jgi:predicted dienelactone hydrolase
MTSPTTATTTAATTLKATPIPTTASDDAITFCSNLHFHQSIYIPASTSHPKLRVTFSTTTNFGNAEEEELPVILFCHPMGAARYMIYGFENLAKKVGVRVVIIDR